MMESTCFCGVPLTGSDMDQLVSAGLEHFGSTHPEVGLTPTGARNHLEGEQRVDGPTERLAEIGEVRVEGAIAHLRDLRFARAQGYPRRVLKDGASAFVGTLSLFRRHGLEIASEDPLVVELAL